MRAFLRKYNFNSFDLNLDTPAHENLNHLFTELQIPIYIMIDEYDNFINNILMHDESDYQKLVSSKNEAIYKEFFKLLKSATSDNNSSLKKMFITGVSPLALFDVTSGSNIGINITNELAFNSAVGVTKEEFKKLLNHYEIDSNTIKIDEWYDNYKFSKHTKESIYNTDMILYYVKSLIITKYPPDNLVNLNVRTDYSKLRYLVYTDNRLNGNFSVLQKLF